MTEEEAIRVVQRVIRNILAGEQIGWNNALHWAANWIETQIADETNERTCEFAANMCMSIRAAKRPVS